MQDGEDREDHFLLFTAGFLSCRVTAWRITQQPGPLMDSAINSFLKFFEKYKSTPITQKWEPVASVYGVWVGWATVSISPSLPHRRAKVCPQEAESHHGGGGSQSTSGAYGNHWCNGTWLWQPEVTSPAQNSEWVSQGWSWAYYWPLFIMEMICVLFWFMFGFGGGKAAFSPLEGW